MAKPILYYALAKAFSYSSGFDVIGVTSEAHRQVYGRSLVNDAVTHVRAADVIYRFPEGTTAEFALSARARADGERGRHQAEIERARQRVKNLEGHRDMCVLDAAKGLSELGVPRDAEGRSAAEIIGEASRAPTSKPIAHA